MSDARRKRRELAEAFVAGMSGQDHGLLFVSNGHKVDFHAFGDLPALEPAIARAFIDKVEVRDMFKRILEFADNHSADQLNKLMQNERENTKIISLTKPGDTR